MPSVLRLYLKHFLNTPKATGKVTRSLGFGFKILREKMLEDGGRDNRALAGVEATFGVPGRRCVCLKISMIKKFLKRASLKTVFLAESP